MKILGIDPGLNTTGFGVIEVESDRLSCLEYGGISTRSYSEFAEKLEAIFDRLLKVIEEFQPTACAIEDIFYHENVKTAIIMGHVRGISILAARKGHIPVFEYSPREVKLSIVGSGAASKKQVQEMVKTLLGLTTVPRPVDAADALAVAICHSHRSHSHQLLALT